MGKRSRSKRARREARVAAPPAPTNAQAQPAARPPGAEPTEPPARDGTSTPTVGWSLAAGLIALAALAAPGEGAEFPGLWDAGRLGLGLAAAGLAWALWRERAPSDAHAPGWLWTLAAGLGALGLGALLGRNPTLHASPFALTHQNFVGAPTALAFAALAAGVEALRRRPRAAPARALLALGTAWATASLLVPIFQLGTNAVPIALAADALGEGAPVPALSGALIAVTVLPALAGWALLSRPPGEAPSGTLRGLALGGLAVVLAGHAATATWAGGGLVVGVLLAVALAATTLAAARAAAACWDAVPRLPAQAPDWLLPGVALALYGLLKTHGMGPSNTDENIYFYMAADLAHGRWPYVDYFFAHPPLHVLVPGLFFSIFGYSLALAKLFSAVAGGVAGWAVWSIGRRHFGRLEGLVGMVAFLFAAEVLKATTNMTGVNLTTMWMMLGLRAWLRGRGLTAGLLLAAAATTGFYAMAAVMAALALGIFRDRRFFLRLALGFAGLFGFINLAFYAAAGDAFVQGVYTYHGLKAFQDPAMVPLTGGERPLPSALLHNLGVMVHGRPFGKELYYHAHLWVAFAVAPALGLGAYLLDPARRAAPWRFLDPRRLWREVPTHRDAPAALLWLVALALFFQYSMFHELYSFYFTLIYPVLGALVGYVLVGGWRLLWELPSPPEGRAREAGPRRVGPRVAAGAAALVAFGLWQPWSVHALGESYYPALQAARASGDRAAVRRLRPKVLFPDEIAQRGKRNEYVWRDPPVLASLGGVVRALFWRDFRIKGGMEPGYRYYLWTKKRSFESLDRVAAYVREHTAPQETITGGSTMAPLVALAAGRRLAGGVVDTNSKRFKVGLLSPASFWERVCADDVTLLVSIPRSFFNRAKLQRDPTVRAWFRPVKVFYDEQLHYGGRFPITLYARRQRGGPPEAAPAEAGPSTRAPVCRYEGPPAGGR